MKKEFETFREPTDYNMRILKKDNPTCFNGRVEIKKYRITIEEIEEPKEIYAERIQKLWDECDNYHHWQPIKNKAKELGVEIKKLRR